MYIYLFIYVYCIVNGLSLYDDLVIADQCWRASAWNDLSQHAQLNQSYIVSNAISIEYCDYIMAETMKYVRRNGGWSTDGDTETTAVNLMFIDGLGGIISELIQEDFFPIFSEFYNVPPEMLQVAETFIVQHQYEEGAQNGMAFKEDGCEYSFVLQLNDPYEFEGGGTRLETDKDSVIELEQGEMLIYPGRLWHADTSITSGTQLILIGYLTIVPNANGDSCTEIMTKLNIVITNHLDDWIELFWYDQSIGFIPPGKWIEIGSYHSHHFMCNDNLCNFWVDFRQRYYDIWP